MSDILSLFFLGTVIMALLINAVSIGVELVRNVRMEIELRRIRRVTREWQRLLNDERSQEPQPKDGP